MSFLPISEIGNLPRGDAHGMVLYRLYDDMKSLLYVGITSSIVTRVNTHSRTKIWFQRTKSINIEKCKSRTQAESLEKIAILNEKPRYNKTYNNGNKDRVYHDDLFKMEITLELWRDANED